MASTTKWWLMVPLTIGLIVAACGGDDASDDDATSEAPASATAQDAGAQEDAVAQADDDAGDGATVAMLGDEEISLDRALCYFEEQERAGLGGVWTHTSQVTGTTADGEPVVIGLDRARDEDGTVEDSIYVDIGEIGADDIVSLTASGPEGLVDFALPRSLPRTSTWPSSAAIRSRSRSGSTANSVERGERAS